VFERTITVYHKHPNRGLFFFETGTEFQNSYIKLKKRAKNYAGGGNLKRGNAELLSSINSKK